MATSWCIQCSKWILACPQKSPFVAPRSETGGPWGQFSVYPVGGGAGKSHKGEWSLWILMLVTLFSLFKVKSHFFILLSQVSFHKCKDLASFLKFHVGFYICYFNYVYPFCLCTKSNLHVDSEGGYTCVGEGVYRKFYLLLNFA